MSLWSGMVIFLKEGLEQENISHSTRHQKTDTVGDSNRGYLLLSGLLLGSISRSSTFVLAEIKHFSFFVVNLFQVSIDQPDLGIFRGLLTHVGLDKG